MRNCKSARLRTGLSMLGVVAVEFVIRSLAAVMVQGRTRSDVIQ